MRVKLNNNKHLIILTILIIIQIINIIFWGTQKEGYHIDEIFSYGLSNSYYNPFPYYNNEDKIISAPKKWMNVDMPIDIYENQKGWQLM